jgi:hypothetical protein
MIAFATSDHVCDLGMPILRHQPEYDNSYRYLRSGPSLSDPQPDCVSDSMGTFSMGALGHIVDLLQQSVKVGLCQDTKVDG